MHKKGAGAAIYKMYLYSGARTEPPRYGVATCISGKKILNLLQENNKTWRKQENLFQLLE